MADKKKCDNCNKKINGINSIANTIGETVLCSKCYEALAPFKISKKYNTKEEINDAQDNCIKKATELGYSLDIINSLNIHFEDKKRKLIVKEDIEQYLMTTGSLLEGYKIEKYLGIVSGQVVLGTGFLSGYDAGFADFFGSESVVYTEKLDEARKVAKERAIKKSIALGGNALIAVDIELVTFSRDMISVVVNGTSVFVNKIE